MKEKKATENNKRIHLKIIDWSSEVGYGIFFYKSLFYEKHIFVVIAIVFIFFVSVM